MKHTPATAKSNFYFNVDAYDRRTLQELADFPDEMRSPYSRQIWEPGISGDQRLTPVERLLAIMIISHLNLHTQRCYPDQDRLAKRIGKSVRHLKRLIKRIEHYGWLGIGRHNYRKHG